MQGSAKIIGIYPVVADEPVHLIELLVKAEGDQFDLGEITQEIPGEAEANWQVAYDERLLENRDGSARYVFFFHYLNFSKPLMTPFGPMAIPKPTPIPTHLQHVQYEGP